jgi:hypothetical protein
MPDSSYGPKPARRGWTLAIVVISLAFISLAVISLAAPLVLPAKSDSEGETTGSVSKVEPALQQDGSPAHPFADASQCPSSTDLIFWPSGRLVPSLPAGISVCFVGNQSFEIGDSDVQLRGR